MTDWLDRVALDFDHLETDFRLALRALARGLPHRRLNPRRWDWRRATRAAGIRGCACPMPINTGIGLQAPEHGANKQAGKQNHPAATLRLFRQLASRDTADRQLDLALPTPAEPVDRRQLHLQLVAA